MRHLEAFLDSLRNHTLARAECPSARFLLQTRGNPDLSEVRRRAQAVFGPAAISVAPALESTDPALSRFFILEVPGGAAALAPATALDVGYDLEDALDLASVELMHDDVPVPDADESTASAALDTAEDPEWHLKNIRAEKAWMLSRGAGVTIGQPDTGMADHHLLSDAMIVEPLFNLIERGKPPYDPLRHGSNGSSGSSPWHPGHGTAVASNAVSRGNDADKRMRGAAPEAKALPIRCVESVLLTDFQASILAEAIGLAGARCQVVSMSLGGAGAVLSAVVHVAIKQAAERGVVFVAAAGNYTWRFPVYPALDYFCAAIAGSTWTDEGWYWSGGGSHVTVSAPADGVWTAWRAPKDGYATRKVGQSTGTSYAAAIVGGVAALWIAQHGHANLLRRYGEGWKVTKAFQLLLKRSARTPAGWNKGYYGEGIVDADALLRANLDDVVVLDASPEAGERRELRERLLATPDVDPAAVQRLDDALFDRYGRELSRQLALADLARHAKPGVQGPRRVPLSQSLQAALTRADARSIAAALSS